MFALFSVHYVFLNQVCVGCKPMRAWFLETALVRTLVCVCVCVCVCMRVCACVSMSVCLPPRVLKIIGMICCDTDRV